jgi:ankyrin repeat protein
MPTPLFITLVQEYNANKYNYASDGSLKNDFDQKLNRANISRISYAEYMNINAKEESGNKHSALHYAAHRGDEYIVNKLIEYGANINIINQFNQNH